VKEVVVEPYGFVTESFRPCASKTVVTVENVPSKALALVTPSRFSLSKCCWVSAGRIVRHNSIAYSSCNECAQSDVCHQRYIRRSDSQS